MNFRRKLSVLVLLLEAASYSVGTGPDREPPDRCPMSAGLLQRVGLTRFYILHKPERSDFVSWKEAAPYCEKYGLKLATIKKLTTLAWVGRPLEDIVRDQLLKDTWYWLDATYDPQQENYVWGDGTPLTYHNYFYRQARPLGVGSHVNFDHYYNLTWKDNQCLSLALPWPGLADGNPEHGHATTFDERACVSKRKRHALCESTQDTCKLILDDPFVLTEDKDSYFDDGNWIIGNRKYIVNWKQRTFDESQQYCKDLGMTMYHPQQTRDVCLIPYLKMWSRNLTVSQFWTSWSYHAKKSQFFDANGRLITTASSVKIEFSESRSNKFNETFCVSSTLYYEFKDQQPCVSSGPFSCNWHFMEYVPANCKSYLGTICQHHDHPGRSCVFQGSYLSNVDYALTRTATVKFGYQANTMARRSRYKQTFGSLICETPKAVKTYRMARKNNTDLFLKPRDNTPNVYIYDYLETYWVVDEEMFNKDADSMCTISKPKSPTNGHERELELVKCTEWHFYICEKITKPLRPYTGFVPQRNRKMVWNKSRQPRVYPLLLTK